MEWKWKWREGGRATSFLSRGSRRGHHVSWAKGFKGQLCILIIEQYFFSGSRLVQINVIITCLVGTNYLCKTNGTCQYKNNYLSGP